MQGDRAAEELPSDLRVQVEAMARRLGADRGEWTLEFQLRDGRYRKAFVKHGPIGAEELEQLGGTGALA